MLEALVEQIEILVIINDVLRMKKRLFCHFVGIASMVAIEILSWVPKRGGMTVDRSSLVRRQ